MAAPRPNRVKTSHLKSRILHLSQTSVYQVKVQPTPDVIGFLAAAKGIYYQSEGEDLELLCHETSLPGTSLFTHEVTNDYHGVTEKMAYRRSYDDTIDMSFYVDRSYKVIDMFEGWIDYMTNQGNYNVFESPYANYRMNYPDTYKSNIHITKFERDPSGPNMNYTFIGAFPTSINAMPVSYDGSDILRCNVSFSFTRYVRRTSRSAPYGGDFSPLDFSFFNSQSTGTPLRMQSAGASGGQGVTGYNRERYNPGQAASSALNPGAQQRPGVTPVQGN